MIPVQRAVRLPNIARARHVVTAFSGSFLGHRRTPLPWGSPRTPRDPRWTPLARMTALVPLALGTSDDWRLTLWWIRERRQHKASAIQGPCHAIPVATADCGHVRLFRSTGHLPLSRFFHGYRLGVLALVLVSLSVGMDNFGAATAMGLSGVGGAERLRIATVFGLFEGVMPVLGLLVGHSLSRSLGGSAPLVGGLLLVGAGAYSILRELFEREKGPGSALRPAGMRRLLVLGLALSIDNLVVGFAFGTYHVSFVLAVVLITLVSVGLSLLGLEIGNRLAPRLGERGELLGGAILIAIGISIATRLL